MPGLDEIVLWKAPQPGRAAARELEAGFDPADYPEDGPYFAARYDVADQFRKAYANGLQTIYLPQQVFQVLTDQGILKPDPHYPPGWSWHVPPAGLPQFNEAIREGSPNIYQTEEACAARAT